MEGRIEDKGWRQEDNGKREREKEVGGEMQGFRG